MKEQAVIAVLDAEPLNPGDISWAPLEKFGQLRLYPHTTPAETAARVNGADIVLVNKVELQREHLPALANCRLAGVLATGCNNIDLAALGEAGIAVCNVPGYGPEDVAQHALALILELARGVGAHARSVRAGEWSRRGWCWWNTPQKSLTGLTLGIIGFGAIGRALGRYGHALGMNILAASRSRNDDPGYPATFATPAQVLASADILSLHCPLTEVTRNLINADSINKMKTGAMIINTARGPLVDEDAVANALASGKLAGYGADVLAMEPPAADNPLFEAPNALITPHLAWATSRARQNIIAIMAANIAAFLGGEPRNIVNSKMLADS